MTLPQPYFSLNLYSSDAKTSLINSAHRIMSFTNTMQLDEPGKIEITCPLTDPNTAGFSKTTYAEILVGSPTQTTWATGYVQSITRNVARSNEYQIVLASPSIILSDLTDAGALIMDFGQGYLNLLDAINGLNAPGTGASPGQKGYLTGSNAVARWYDTSASVVSGTTATSGGVAIGNQSIGVSSTSGATQYNAVRINGTDIYEVTNINGGSNISIHPAAFNRYGFNTRVEYLNYQLPGTNHRGWRGDWGNMQVAMKALAGDYGFHSREAKGSTLHNLTMQLGQFGDPSGLTVYGGNGASNSLLSFLQGYGYSTLTQANVHLAQKLGLSVINGPQYQDDLTHVRNVVWGIGHGPAGKFVDLKTIFGNINTGATFQPYGAGSKKWFTGPSYTVTTLGRTKTYVLIAEQQNDTKYAYGVMDQTSVTTYGPHEYVLVDHTIKQQDHLLSACLAACDQFSDPIPTWVLPVKHAMNTAMDANRVPPKVLPGQKIDVQYSGAVAAVDTDSNTNSKTYGQLIPTGATYSYLAFPLPSDSTYPFASRCMKIVEQWAGHEFTCTYTMGRGHQKPKHYYEDLVRKLHTVSRKPVKKNSFTKTTFEDIQWWTSTNPLVYDDERNNVLNFAPGSLAVTDIQDVNFFDDSHGVSFTFTLTDAAGALEFLFGKPVNTNLTSLNVGSAYGVFRIAGLTSGKQSGFFVTSNGSAYTAKGGFHRHGLFTPNRQINAGYTLRVTVGWHQGEFVAMVSEPSFGSASTPKKVATWIDYAVALPQFGAIGFSYTGGSSASSITGIGATELHHPPHTLRKSVGKGQMHVGSPYSKRNGPNTSQSGGVNGTGRRYGAPLPI